MHWLHVWQFRTTISTLQWAFDKEWQRQHSQLLQYLFHDFVNLNHHRATRIEVSWYVHLNWISNLNELLHNFILLYSCSWKVKTGNTGFYFPHHSDPGDEIAAGLGCGKKVNVFVEDRRLQNFAAKASLKSSLLLCRQWTSVMPSKSLLIEDILLG